MSSVLFFCKRNFCSSNDRRFSGTAPSLSSSAIRTVSFALANAKDYLPILFEPLLLKRLDFLDEGLLESSGLI